MRFSLGIPFMALFFAATVKAETCLPVQGLQFEKIGWNVLLIIKDGKNWGTMNMFDGVPDGKLEFRFFTPTICDGTQNDKIHINGKLRTIDSIKAFK
jgi:hypothetical protein